MDDHYHPERGLSVAFLLVACELALLAGGLLAYVTLF